MGVRREFRESSFVTKSGLHIAHDLMDDVIGRFGAIGVSRIRAVVDADNPAAQFFYRGLGWSFARANVPGWGDQVVESVLEI